MFSNQKKLIHMDKIMTHLVKVVSGGRLEVGGLRFEVRLGGGETWWWGDLVEGR